MTHSIDEITACLKNQDQWRGTETVNMIASENMMSKAAQQLIVSDFEHRYAEGLIGERGYQGQKFQDEIEQIAVDLTKELFGTDFADVRCPTATTLNLAIFLGLAKANHDYYSLTVPSGAHISFRKFGGAGCRGLNIHDIPYDNDNFNIDVEKFTEEILTVKPRLITLGGSVYLFPHPVKEIAAVCKEAGTILHYDGSHVLGLIAGGEFQQPMAEGADVMIGSTHKTFPGPQGAIAVTNNKKYFKKIQRAIFPGLVSNHHLWRLAPLAVTLLEMKKYGKVYAKQTISNAKALATALDKVGINVLAKKFGFTQSHQVVVDVSEYGGGSEAATNLELANIICNKNLLVQDDISVAFDSPSGLRLGTQELTRIGMKEADMKSVADFYGRIIINKEDPLKVKSEITAFRQQFPQIHYSLDVE
jgi:glycine hydroxymethyltransferase